MGEDTISVSVKQAVAVVFTAATVIGVPVGINKLSAESRADPYTGSEGRALAERHATDLAEVWRWVRGHERFKADSLVDTESRIRALEEQMKAHLRDHGRTTHRHRETDN